jgi:hypothetical protein
MPALSFRLNSVTPVTALALTHSTVKVDWYLPNIGSKTTLTSGSGSTTTITVSSTRGLLVGSYVKVIAGTGAFSSGTTVLLVTSSTTFLVSAAPSTTLSGATIAATPSDYKVIRLVRNQYAFSENQEDGEILYEYDNTMGYGTGTITSFTDGVDTSLSTVALVSGQYAYYTVWLLIVDTWVNAGTSSVLLPKQHSTYANGTTSLKSTHMKIMELLPRVLTSTSNSPFDAVDKTSDLYKFMRGIALAYDELLTYADLTVRSLPAKFISDYMVLNAFNHFGLRVTSISPTIYKKNLISKAPYLIANKGTKNALTTFVESFTGFNTTVNDTTNPTSNSVSLSFSNLLLTAQDSSFHKGGLGSWQKVSNATLSVEGSVTLTGGSGSTTTITVASTTGLGVGSVVKVTAGTGSFVAGTTVTSVTNATTFVVSTSPSSTLIGATIVATIDVPSTEQYSFKSPYRLKVVTVAGSVQTNFRLALAASTSQALSLKEAIKSGIPISPGQSYSFSFMRKTTSGTSAMTPYIDWRDAYGNSIQVDNGTAAASSSSWGRTTFTSTSPGKKFSAISYTVGTSSTNTKIVTTSTHGLSSGDKVYFEDEILPFNGVYTAATGTSGTEIYIPYYQNNISLTPVSSSVNGTIYTFTIGSGSTKYVRVGQSVTITSSSSTGVLGGSTKVTSILNDTQFTVDVQPSVALSGATISLNTYTVTTNFTVFKANTGGTGKETPAEYAIIGFKQAARDSTFNLDSIQFGLASYVSNGFIEARCVDIYIEPSKVNYIVDPTFAGSGWSYAGGATSPAGYSNSETTTLTGIPYVSTSKMGKVITGASNSTAAAPDLKTTSPTPVDVNNTYYTFSIYIKGDDNYSLTLGLTDGVNSTEKVINVTTSWQRVSVTLYVKSIATGLTPYIYSNSATPVVVDGVTTSGNGTRSAAQTFRIDNAQLEMSQKATDYFDGNFINQGAKWVGQSNASKSYLYVNKSQKISELSIHMNDWIPLNMTWMVRSIFGIEALGTPYTTPVVSTTPYSGTGGLNRTLIR